MRTIVSVLAVILLLSNAIPYDISDASDHSPLLLTAVMPAGSFEGFAITNTGFDAVDLRDYHVTDGEGNITFQEQIMIGSLECIYFLKSSPAEWFSVQRYMVFGENGIKNKSFSLNDSGDDIYLMKGDTLVDAFVYGSGSCVKGGWNGEPFQKISKKYVAQRISFNDTDSKDDWTARIPGRSSYPSDIGEEALVTPFVFPDSQGTPIFDALCSAEKEIDISIYLMNHPTVIGVLLERLKDHVKVNILADGSPAGGIGTTETTAFNTLVKAGADIRLISSSDGYRRYTYLHTKYAVIDDKKIIITSENWQYSSFTSNRGWGAIIESAGAAQYMKNIFSEDFNGVDVKKFRELYQITKITQTAEYDKYILSGKTYDSYPSIVDIVVSPDNSLDAMRRFLHGAEERVYCEQLDMDDDWIHGTDNPVYWLLEASAVAGDSRLILDVTFDEEGSGNFEHIAELNGVNGLQARSPSISAMVHNKGVIADDSVWVGSVNWTYTSFSDNREAAAVIHSKEVADFYAGYFLIDWDGYAVEEVSQSFEIFTEGELKENRAFIIGCEGDTAKCNIGWDTDGDGTIDRSGERILIQLSPGKHTVTLIVEKGGQEYRFDKEIVIEDTAEGNDASPFTEHFDIKYAPFILAAFVILVIRTFKRFAGKHGTDKGIQRRRY